MTSETLSSAAARKPKLGTACNGCGLCCLRTQCIPSKIVFGDRAICPALEWTENISSCGLITRPLDHLPADIERTSGPTFARFFRLELVNGGLCDAPDGITLTLEDREGIAHLFKATSKLRKLRMKTRPALLKAMMRIARAADRIRGYGGVEKFGQVLGCWAMVTGRGRSPSLLTIYATINRQARQKPMPSTNLLAIRDG